MKKVILTIIFGIVIVAFSIYKIRLLSSLKIDESFGYHRILLDSMRIDDTNNIYWFKYNTGVHGYVGDYIAVSSNSNKIDSVNALLKSSYIEQIDTVRNDSVFIYLSQHGYQLINKSNYKIIPLTPESYWDISKPQLYINLDSIVY